MILLCYVDKIKQIDLNNTSVEDHLKIVTLYMSIQEKLMFKVAQIHYYNWLEDKDISKIFSNMTRHIANPAELVYEEKIIDYKPNDGEYTESNYIKIDEFLAPHLPNKNIRFSARVDAITDSVVWEFKCTDSLEIEHQLQVIIYAWIWKMTRTSGRTFKLMNIRTSEVQTLDYRAELIDEIILLILKHKYTVKETYSDETFIERCLNVPYSH